MTGCAGSALPENVVRCCICAGPIPIESCKTDEHGKVVHEECYVRQTLSTFGTAHISHAPGNWLSSVLVRPQFARQGGFAC
jgi:hypothetical protein